MSSPTVPAALVGKAAAAVAGLAYLNARFSIGQDLDYLLGRRAAFSALMKTGKDFVRELSLLISPFQAHRKTKKPNHWSPPIPISILGFD